MDDVFQEGEVFGRLTRQETTIELPPNDIFGISEVFGCGCDPSWYGRPVWHLGAIRCVIEGPNPWVAGR